jgi:hypothetical protein
MGTWKLEVEAGQGSATFHVSGEEIGDGAPDPPWCRDYEEVEEGE